MCEIVLRTHNNIIRSNVAMLSPQNRNHDKATVPSSKRAMVSLAAQSKKSRLESTNNNLQMMTKTQQFVHDLEDEVEKAKQFGLLLRHALGQE
jgi:hypothetical protein